MIEQINVRQAISSDIARLISMDHGFTTDHVWQLSFHKQPREIGATFREVRLPRSMQVVYPRDPKRLADEWTHLEALLLVEVEEHPAGYVAMSDGPAEGSGWITDVVVDLRFRRQGIASRLLAAGKEWCRTRDRRLLFMEMQTKNYPAICLAQRTGFLYAGYSDLYYPDQDIALFFAVELD
ncbi:MAG: GNAT family N-acetyltransferase [Anaerolineales bacterium]|nr:GNAT family N-acetyltransferase [Anaerolineales bacterium]